MSEHAPEAPGIEVHYWKGQKRYECPLKWESGKACAYDTYDLELLQEHMRMPHTRSGKLPPPGARPQQVISSILDERGQPIVKTVVEPDRPVPAEFRNARIKEE